MPGCNALSPPYEVSLVLWACAGSVTSRLPCPHTYVECEVDVTIQDTLALEAVGPLHFAKTVSTNVCMERAFVDRHGSSAYIRPRTVQRAVACESHDRSRGSLPVTPTSILQKDLKPAGAAGAAQSG